MITALKLVNTKHYYTVLKQHSHLSTCIPRHQQEWQDQESSEAHLV